MKTMEMWNESKVDFGKFINNGDEIDEELYDYFLGVVPPYEMGSGYFLLGEPYDTDKAGNLLFDKFTHKRDKFYYEGLVPR